MAFRTLISLNPAPTRCFQPDYRKPNPFSRCSTQKGGSIRSSGITRVSFQSSQTRLRFSKTRPVTTNGVLLPISNPERFDSAENIPKWSQKAVCAFSLALPEAYSLKFDIVGTECLLIAMSKDGTSLASKVLRAYGITLSKLREETIKVVGGDVQEQAPDDYCLTHSARRALDWAVDENLKSGRNEEITTCHLLLGVWAEEKSVGHKILANLGCNDEIAKKLHSAISQPGFVEK